MHLRLFAFNTAIFLVLFFCASAGFASAHVFISEIMWSGTDLSSSDEWLEIGSSSGTVSLGGWKITSLNSSGIDVSIAEFGSGASIGSGEYLVVSRFSATGSRLLEDPFLQSSRVSLPNTKLLVKLIDAGGHIIDQADDGVGNPIAGSNAAFPQWKASMERISSTIAGNTVAAWRTATTFLGFDDGASLFGTPGYQNATGPSVDTFPPLEATNVDALVERYQTGSILFLRWKPSISLDLKSQKLTFNPSLPTGSSSVVLPATASGFTIKLASEISYTIFIHSIDHKNNTSEGVEIFIEPYIEPILSSSPSSFSFASYSSFSSETSSASSQFSSISSSSSASEFSSSFSTSSSSSLISTQSSESSDSSDSSSAQSSVPSLPFPSSSSLSPSPPSLPRVLLSEILPDPIGTDDGQWIEILNSGIEEVDITGWTLQYGSKTYTLGGSGSVILSPGSHISFWRSQTSFTFSHKGGEVFLKRGLEVIDSLQYPELPEEVSYGRGSSGTLVPYCVPTESALNGSVEWNPALTIQTGTLRSEEKVTVNVEVTAPKGSLSSSHCSILFGDGSMSDACNPPSHTFSTVGQYTINAQIVNYCGTTVSRTLLAEVLPKITASSSPAASSSRATSNTIFDQSSSVSSGIELVAALPNPKGTDTNQEYVMIQNTNAHSAVLKGWKLLLTPGNKSVALDAIEVSAKKTKSITASDVSFTLGNSSGSIALKNPQGATVSVISWKTAREAVLYGPQSSKRYKATLEKIIDGDTLDVRFDTSLPFTEEPIVRIRFIGIDAPEITNANAAIIAYGNESKTFLGALLENKKIELQFDTELFDTYGRLLAYVYDNSGHSLQEQMLENGMATVIEGYSFSQRTQYEEIENAAREAGRGQWKSHTSVVLGENSVAEEETSHTDFSALRISEVYASPASGEAEWIEIENTGDEPIVLKGLFLSHGQLLIHSKCGDGNSVRYVYTRGVDDDGISLIHCNRGGIE
jgi:endonuclease YncB( thermonuclease family)